MASNFDSPELWRLKTPGGIPYKYRGLTGAFDREAGSIIWSVLIESTKLLSFLEEMFPNETQFSEFISVPQYFQLPELPGFGAVKVNFSSFDDSLPCDPFGHDTGADSGTYYPVIKCDVAFDTLKTGEDPNDPITFLEISSNTSGEFLTSPAPKAKWKSDGGPAEAGTTEENKDPNVAAQVLVPTTEWNVRWKQLSYEYFRDVVLVRLRKLLGRVNDDDFRSLFVTEPETLLMAGYSYNQTNTWRRRGSSEVQIPPVTLNIKFIEKHVVYNGSIKGHNHFWRPGKGWDYLLVDGENPTYRQTNFNALFSSGG